VFDDPTMRSVLHSIYSSYASNLELHRLTQDPASQFTRYTKTPELDDPNTQMPQNLIPPTVPTDPNYLAPNVYHLANNSRVTVWGRRETRVDNNPLPNLSGEDTQVTPITATVQELERNHYITLTPGQVNAIVAIRPLPKRKRGES
jgi:hypothetical protein